MYDLLAGTGQAGSVANDHAITQPAQTGSFTTEGTEKRFHSFLCVLGAFVVLPS